MGLWSTPIRARKSPSPKQPETPAADVGAEAGAAPVAAKPKTKDYVKPTLAEHFVNLHGADIVRLWVASVNFTDEVPFGEQMFARLSETYRRLRNTLRILLGNLADFDPPTTASRSCN